MKIIRTRAELRTLTEIWRREGSVIGVVPTMGALHEGHLSLVRGAEAQADRVIVTLFVNPTQFNNPEDLKNYPKTEEDDVRKLAPFAVDVLWAPGAEEMYPEGFATKISVDGISEGLCGGDRPGHFDGVATVVTKLLTQTDADLAFFGEKDWQQLQVVTRLVADLDLRARIVGMPTVREADGLALSSRNLRLTPEKRAAAAALPSEMKRAAAAISGGADAGEALAAARAAVLAAGFNAVDYLELRDGATLAPLDKATPTARIFAAAHIGAVRLIDNMALSG